MFVSMTAYVPTERHQDEGPCLISNICNQLSAISVGNVLEKQREVPLLAEKFHKNEIIYTDSQKYQLLSSLGKGVFGEILLGRSYTTGETVAIKILKDKKNIHKVASREIDFLEKLKEGNAHLSHIIQLQYSFKCEGQFCLVFEVLEEDLHIFLKKRKWEPLPLNHIRPILNQILVGLAKLQELEIIHTDLKTDNIMFVNSQRPPYRIKIIDFGNAIQFNEVSRYRKLQSLRYRSPEIILGAPFNSAIDMWSVGCIATTMYLGSCLYKGNTEYDQIRLICETQGFPRRQLAKGRYTKRYFHKRGSAFWSLKTPGEYKAASGKEPGDGCAYRFSSLDDLMQFSSVVDSCMTTIMFKDKQAFVDLVKRMLALNEYTRIAPKPALQHPFITSKNCELK